MLYIVFIKTLNNTCFRSDIGAIVEGVVLEVMFESTRDAYVYKYQVMSSKSVEYISIEDLAICEWTIIQNTNTATNKKIISLCRKYLFLRPIRKRENKFI